MNLLLHRRWMPLCEGDGKGGAGSDSGAGTPGGDPSQPTGTPEPPEPTKTFTQEDLNRIAAQEKRQGQNSILKALGFETEEEAKKYLDAKRKEDDDKKDDLQKAQEATQAANAAKSAAEAKAELIEKKYKVIALGVSSERVDDIVTLANAKAVDGKSFDDAVAEVKTNYPELFNQQEKRGGTGSNGNPPRKNPQGTESSLGKRLAEQRKTSKSQDAKDSYFTTN